LAPGQRWSRAYFADWKAATSAIAATSEMPGVVAHYDDDRKAESGKHRSRGVAN
jgi:hypothetical protein